MRWRKDISVGGEEKDSRKRTATRSDDGQSTSVEEAANRNKIERIAKDAVTENTRKKIIKVITHTAVFTFWVDLTKIV